MPKQAYLGGNVKSKCSGCRVDERDKKTMQISLTYDNKITPILVEKNAFEGVKRIAAKVAGDIESIMDRQWSIISENELNEHKQVILCATIGNSPLLQKLEKEGKIKLEELHNKREVFKIQMISNPFGQVEQAVIICGSDKRGTIYGMFSFSEYIGISPLCFFGDVVPAKKAILNIDQKIEITSKEPSVRYRGFFINDEWPCFGTWATSHYGGFNTLVYEHIFEFLLRLKGNYLWPAMWNSSFPIDGPGSANEELADIYGVVIGFSHHEPCLRASEEWDKVRGINSPYGNEWNFYTNETGLLKYWEDSIKRSGKKYENIITIGMRGERDTSMLGENSTLEENVDLLKRIIIKQRELIGKYVDNDIEKVPQLLALYKEVEEYFYGNESVKGLKEWEELEGVICMLCEDNFGYMRSLPSEEIRNRKGGFGMYYHFDYHGGPISYEWVDSTPLSKTWEQMSMAYEYGIRDVWIVNVGDLKFHEVPLTYFMALAYDYDRWGYSNPSSYREYIEKWVLQTFPQAEVKLQAKVEKVFRDYIDMNGLRRPESLNPFTYHPCHYLETDRMLKWAEEVEKENEEVYVNLNSKERDAYYSMIYFSAKASMNLLKMHLYAGKNDHYANQGKKAANIYGDKVAECIQLDREFAIQFAEFKDGKWKGMELAQHIGFVKWNEDDYRYPIIKKVEPAHKPRMKVSRKDSIEIGVKNYGPPAQIKVDDFLSLGCEEVILEIANDGIASLNYNISVDSPKGDLPSWLSISKREGTVETQEEVLLYCDRSKLTEKKEVVRLLIKDNETCIAIQVEAQEIVTIHYPPMTFFPHNGIIVMDASHYARKLNAENEGFCVLADYGKHRSGVKVFPSTASYKEGLERPKLIYQFVIQEAGSYRVELCLAPTNPLENKQRVHLLLESSLYQCEKVIITDEFFRPGESSDVKWSKGVLDQERVVTQLMKFEQGLQELTIGAMEAGVVLEKVRIYPEEISLKPSYMGPRESFYLKREIDTEEGDFPALY